MRGQDLNPQVVLLVLKTNVFRDSSFSSGAFTMHNS